MAEYEQKVKPKAKRKKEEPVEQVASVKDSAALKAELDELLDEIDEVLEANAELFVREYVQRGGE